MWVRDSSRNLINLAFAEKIYVYTEEGSIEVQVRALMRGGSRELLYTGPTKQDCQYWMDKLGVRLASVANA